MTSGMAMVMIQLWSWLSSIIIRWNFEKFLLDHNGQPVRRYDESLDPSQIIPDIESLLDNIPHNEDDGVNDNDDEITTVGPS